MRLSMMLAAMAALVLAAPAVVEAQAPSATAEAQAAAREADLRAALHPTHGLIDLPAASARLNLGERFEFLDAAAAKRLLTEGWGNPPAATEGVLGLIYPRGMDLLGDGAWAAVITYDQTFYVSDKEVGKSDYDKLIADMQAHEADANAERQKAGFSTVHLVGWAEPPAYDRARHNLVWARDIRFSDAEHDTLNYDVRHLGRRGVLSLNIVADLSALPQIHNVAHEVAGAAEFTPGARYEDHSWMDKKAGYGLVGLVAAGAGLLVAKKLGFIALVALFAKKGLVLIVATGAAIANWARRLFGLKPKPANLPAPSAASVESEQGPG